LVRNEEVRADQHKTINDKQKTIVDQQNTINDQHSTINLLTDENKALLADTGRLLSEKDSLERELFKASEYILSLEEKCH